MEMRELSRSFLTHRLTPTARTGQRLLLRQFTALSNWTAPVLSGTSLPEKIITIDSQLVLNDPQLVQAVLDEIPSGSSTRLFVSLDMCKVLNRLKDQRKRGSLQWTSRAIFRVLAGSNNLLERIYQPVSLSAGDLE